MSFNALPNIPSLRKQQLHLDFAQLTNYCPPGLYLSLTPENPAIWSGVYFVRSGPYQSALVRLQVTFPDTFPLDVPLITLQTEIFHPLIVPLTTYTFSTSALDSTSTISAADTQRLPPGSFCFQHVFPHWPDVHVFSSSTITAQHKSNAETEELNNSHAPSTDLPILPLLNYLTSSFENPSILDELPLSAAGNPSAWHAWRAHRNLPKASAHNRAGSPLFQPSNSPASRSTAKQPGDWKWDGVWDSRVKNDIETSISDPIVFGTTRTALGHAVSENIRFMDLDEVKIEEIKKKIGIHDLYTDYVQASS